MSSGRASAPIIRLVQAMDRCAVARGEAQWTNGYRAAYEARLNTSSIESDRLYAKEMQQWKAVTKAEKAFTRLAQRVIRGSRASG